MKRLIRLFSQGESCMPLSPVGGKHVEKYQHFRDVLSSNRQALRQLAEMETLYYSGRSFTTADINFYYENLYGHVRSLIFSLNAMAEQRYAALFDKAEEINGKVAALLQQQGPPRKKLQHVEALTALPENSLHSAGGKAVNLSIIARKTALRVPPGFVVTACGFDYFLRENKLDQLVLDELAGVSPGDAGLSEVSARLTARIRAAEIPADMMELLSHHCDQIEKECGGTIPLAVRSSAVREDSEASFAGQYESLLNVDRKCLGDAYKEVLASSFSPRAVAYRHMAGIEVTETPMCVLCMAMIESVASGVLYTADPSSGDADEMHISAVLGLGEQLVSGDAAADTYIVDRRDGSIKWQEIVNKQSRMGMAVAGTEVRTVSWQEARAAALEAEEIAELFAAGLELERVFGGPQDIEWALDGKRRLVILQCRPLQVTTQSSEPWPLPEKASPLAVVGDAASHGAAAGPVYVVDHQENLAAIPNQVVLVTRTASPRYAEVMGRIKALISERGSTTCHLASVAREFGVPMAINVPNATSLLATGDLVTLFAQKETHLYSGVYELPEGLVSNRKRILDSSVHHKMRSVLDHLSPLALTDTQSSDFVAESCQSLHDIVRFVHEQVVREMFSLSAAADNDTPCVKLVTHIPLTLYCIDLGGGLQPGLSTCDRVTADHFTSCPIRALWRGFSHPGINWSGTVQFDNSSFLSRMAASATAELGSSPGGDSFALFGADYLNFSAKFGYHFATLDTLCGEDPDHNYLSLQFSGGAGSFYGKTLRLQFLGKVLSELGLEVQLQGDLLEATLQRFHREEMLETLDHLGRLLACSRLLDMVINNQQDVDHLASEFLQGNYNLLRFKEQVALADLYTHHGDWSMRDQGGRVCCLADGSSTVNRFSSSVSGLIARTFGRSYLDLLDTLGAYYSFPLAISKVGVCGNGPVSLDVKVLGGKVDQSGGLAFGLRDIGNYFVLRISAMKQSAALYEFIDGKRRVKAEVKLPVPREVWHNLSVTVADTNITCTVNETFVCSHAVDKPLHGHVGLWTRADAVTLFCNFSVGGASQLLK